MYSGISGMKAFKSSLDVIGNNIANINTTSYKAGRASFKDMLSQTVSAATAPSAIRGGSNASQVGLGVILGAVDINDAQGSMQATGRGTDLAIEGNGFFAIGNGNRLAYTRDGSFSLDAEFSLVSSGTGMKVLGWAADFDTGVIDTSSPITSASSLKIPVGGLSVARATSKVDIAGNLDASSVAPKQTTIARVRGNLNQLTGPQGTTLANITGSFDQNAADGTVYNVSFNVNDNLGAVRPVVVTFTKNGANTWNYSVTAAGADAGSLPANGSLTFDPANHNSLTPNIPLNLQWGGGATSINASINTSTLVEGTATNATMSGQNGIAPSNPVVMTFNVYDNLGNAHEITATFTKQPAADTWRYSISCPDALAGSLPADANFTFSGTGASNLANIPMSLTLASPNGANPSLSFTMDTSLLTQVASDNSVSMYSQDGSRPGEPVPIKFDIYDSLGLTHEMQLVFKKTSDPATWDYEVVCPDATAASLPPPGKITFNSLGYSQLPNIPFSLIWKNNNGSEQPLTGVINTLSISQLNGATTVDLSYQDGLQLGTLESYDIGRDGLITGVFTNGSTRALGQVALAQFNNPAGLTKTGNNSWAESPNSGTAKIGVPGRGGLGMINSRFLEASNVDLATEFANMIVAQRGFQASSRIISTSDEVLQELVSLKR